MKKLIVLLFVILLVGTVSALDFDDIKSYDEEKRTYTITNLFGLGKHIADVELKTPDKLKVARGYGKVAEFEIRNGEYNYNEVIKKIQLYNLNDDMKEFTRDVDYKYKTTRDVPIYDIICKERILKTLVNGTKLIEKYDCVKKQIGTEERVHWELFDENSLIKGETITIGIFTDVKKGDNVDWVLSVYGKERLTKWATWVEYMNTGLVSYWALNESSGAVLDSKGVNDGVVVSSITQGVDGKIDKAVNYTKGYVNVSNDASLDITDAISISMWINLSTEGGDWRGLVGKSNLPDAYSIIHNDDTDIFRIDLNPLGNWQTKKTLTLNQYYHMVFTWDGSTARIYFDGSLDNSTTHLSGTMSTSAEDLLFGQDPDGYMWKGQIDEIGLWNRSLNSTEVTDLYNGGSGLIFEDDFGSPDNAPIVTASYPINNSNYTASTVTINATVTDDIRVEKVELYIDGTLNQTNSSNQNNTVYTFTVDLADGTYTTYINATDNATTAQSTSGATRYVNIDTSSPSLNITSPFGNISHHITGNNLTLNWNYSDVHTGVCRYEYKGVNTTVTCTDNTTIITDVSNIINTTLIFYSNDSFGNINHSVVTWNYSVWEYERGYNNATTEGATELFYIDFTIQTGSLSTVKLWYEGNDTASSFSAGTINRRYNATLDNFLVPTTNANKVVNFFWEVDYGNQEANTTTSTQHINAFDIDNCTTNTITIYNFTLADEETRLNLTGSNDVTLAKLELNITSYSGSTEVITYNKTYSQINPFRVCLNNTLINENYNIDVLIEYSATGYSTEFYNIQNETFNLTNLAQNITLYDLNSSDAQEFLLVVRDSSFLAVEDALVEVHRKYVDLGAFRIVEIPKTDENGKTVADLVVDDVIYKFIIKKFGETIQIFDNVKAVCQNPTLETCTIDFNAFATAINVPDYTGGEDFNFTLGYNNNTRVISSDFLIPSGSASWITLNVSQTDALGTSICVDSLTSSTGTLTCTLPNSIGNSTVVARLYKDGSYQAGGSFGVRQSPADIYGSIQIILALFIFLTLIGAGLSDNPIFTVLFFMVGVILLFSLNLVASNGFYGATATVLWLFIAIIIVLVKAGRRN